MSSGNHPKTDGQTEVVNRCLETYLRCFTSNKPKQWVSWLHWAEYWYNTTFQRAAGMTPFRALYGREPPALLRWSDEPSAVAEVSTQMTIRNSILDELKANLGIAQSQMKTAADKHRRNITFQIGDHVYVKIQPYRMRSLARYLNEKLRPRFFGPCKIVEQFGPVAFKLDFPPTVQVHPVFHASQLKRCIAPSAPTQPIPACITEERELQVQPEAVRSSRRLLNGDIEVLIKWKHLPECDNSWESLVTIQQQFTTFHLEDKVILEGGGGEDPQSRGCTEDAEEGHIGEHSQIPLEHSEILLQLLKDTWQHQTKDVE